MFRFMSTLSLALTFLGAPAALAHGSDPVRPTRPTLPTQSFWQIQARLEDKLVALERLNDELLDLTSRRPTARRIQLLKDVAHRQQALTRDMRLLQRELADAARGLPRPGWDEAHWDELDERPVYLPEPLSQGELAFLLQSIDHATFPEPQKQAVADVIRSGGFFDNAQAVAIMQRFPHENHKVDVGAMLCPRIVERGALPRLMSTFSFETYRQELRERVGNQCGLLPLGQAF